MSKWLSSLHNPLATDLAQIKQVLKIDLGLWCTMSHEGNSALPTLFSSMKLIVEFTMRE
jgi:hypothetical protein